MNLTMQVRTLAATLVACLSGVAFGVEKAVDAPLFADDTLLTFNLEIPIRELKKGERAVEQSGALVLEDGTRLDVVVKTRGHARLEYCKSMPPIMLDFKKKQLDNTVFAGQNKLKLVTHCRNSDRFDDLVVSEYLLYKILNLMTEASYQVRLVKVTYHDPEDDKPLGPRYGFFIEHKRSLGKRMGLKQLTTDEIQPAQLNADYATPLSVFAFMVGHTDWSTIQGPKDDDCCHNAHLFTPPGWSSGDAGIIPVGYDFDLTGALNPPYGEPPLGLRSWKQRLYRGWCWGGTLIEDNIQLTRQLRSEIERIVTTQPHASERRRKQMWHYLEGYFKIVDNEKRTARYITKACRKLP